MTYSNSYVKAIIVSTFWSATTKYLPQTNSVVRQQFPCLRISALTICQFYFIVAYNFLHTKHYSISDLFRIFLYSTKSNLVTFRWLLYSITIEICWNTYFQLCDILELLCKSQPTFFLISLHYSRDSVHKQLVLLACPNGNRLR